MRIMKGCDDMKESKITRQQLVDATKLSQVLDLPRTSIWRYARQGTIPCYRLGPRLLRFSTSEVLEAIEDKAPYRKITG